MSENPKAPSPGTSHTPPPPPPYYPPPPTPKTWNCGTLTYTRIGLVAIFLWLLWGDLVFTLMEKVFPVSMPFQLERLQIPKFWIFVMMGTLSQVINTTMNPILSFRSDRTRTRWGRRIPFIVTTIVPLCLCLAALGFTDDIGGYIRSAAWIHNHGLSPLVLIILTIGVIILLFDFFNIFVNSIFWYLFADVIPSHLMGRFIALFRAVGIGAGAFFQYFIQGHLETHTRSIYLGAAALYLVGFGLMCWRVREGDYPPPLDVGPRASPLVRLVRAIKIYFTECFSHPIFVSYYLFTAVSRLADACLIAINSYFYVRYLQFSLEQTGHIQSYLSIVSVCIAFPLGWLVDKIHPMRATLLAAVLLIPVSFAGYFTNSLLFYILFWIVRTPCVQFIEAAAIPLNVRLFPRKQYGQFGSANGMVRSFTMIFGNLLAGAFIGYFDDRIGSKACGLGWIWMGLFQTLAFACIIITYLYWKRHGAEKFAYDGEKRSVISAP